MINHNENDDENEKKITKTQNSPRSRHTVNIRIVLT